MAWQISKCQNSEKALCVFAAFLWQSSQVGFISHGQDDLLFS